MKQFLKTLMASMLGTSLALFFMFFMGVVVIATLASSDRRFEEELGVIESDSVLRIDLKGPLKDHVRRRDLLTSILKYDEPPVLGLYELSMTLKKAASDDRIKGVLLNFEGLRSGLANAEGLRRQLLQFKKSGKFIISYAESYSEVDYLVASAVDEVALYPKGYFEWDGFFSKTMYLKNTMEKLNVVPQVFRVGKYKSAIEPFITDKMSEASREQIEALLEGSWQQLLKYAAEKTKLSTDQLNDLANNLAVVYAKDAKEKGFVNWLASFEEVEEKLKELTGQEEKPKYVRWRSYYKEVEQDKSSSKSIVAVVFAEGGIGTEASEDGISSKSLTKLLNKIRLEKEVKAVVIRVNSPGGSALASDVIWTSTQWLKGENKPLVTSFGNVAASGGYYMSAGSRYIFAEPTTITGSIGVFGLTFATKKFWNEKIGMTFDTAKSHRFADMESLVRVMDPQERLKMQQVVDSIYEDFLNVVTSGREPLQSRDQTHEIAQGRVWIGSQAKEIGLVDEMGGLDQAIAKAAEFAELSDYSIEIYPKALSPIQELMKQMGEVSVLAWDQLIPASLRSLIKSQDKQPMNERVLTRLPYDLEIL